MSGDAARQESRKRPRASARSNICHFTDDTFSFRNAIVPKYAVDSDSDSDDCSALPGDAWQRNDPIPVEDGDNEGEEQECSYEDSPEFESSDKDDSIQEVNKRLHVRRSPTPPPPDLSDQTLLKIHQMNSKRQRVLDNVLLSLQQSASCASVMSPVQQMRSREVISVEDMDSPLIVPADRSITVKIRTRLGIKRLHMKAGEPFGKMIKELAQQEGVEEDNIVLSLKDQNISAQDTPLAITLSVADIIECIIIDKPKHEESPESMIDIKVQGMDNASKKTFKVSKFQKLEKLLVDYSKFRKLPRKKLVFTFDGDILKGNETPEELDMEEDNVIDVRIKK